MKTSTLAPIMLPVLMGVMVAGAVWPGQAFPPAPHHLIHGLVRDEMGEPLSLAGAEVFLETEDGVSIATNVRLGVRPGENYRLTIPMDSFTSSDAYKPGALPDTVPFRLKVLIGQTVYVPVEMAVNFANLGEPAGETLINLTLGVDSDGDGLPDAWEKALIQMLGGGLTLADINPNGDSDGDGISDGSEYIAGTYAFDAEDGLRLSLAPGAAQGRTVQFFGIAGRTYTVQGTTNLKDWSPMTFRLSPAASSAPGIVEHYTTRSEMVEIEVVFEPDQPPVHFFRMQVR
jgi:hypothetical protein